MIKGVFHVHLRKDLSVDQSGLQLLNGWRGVVDLIKIFIEAPPIKSYSHSDLVASLNGFWYWDQSTDALSVIVDRDTFKNSLRFKTFNLRFDFWIKIYGYTRWCCNHMFSSLPQRQRDLEVLVAAYSFANVLECRQERMTVGSIRLELANLSNMGTVMESNESQPLTRSARKERDSPIEVVRNVDCLTDLLVVELKSCNIRTKNVEGLLGTVRKKFHS